MRKRTLFVCVLAIAALLIPVDDAEAKRLKKRTRDRNVPTGWCTVPTADLMLFRADGPSADIKITANDYSEGIFVDNIYVVAASALNTNTAEDPCDFAAQTYDLSAFSQQPYFEIFDVEPNGWSGINAFFVPAFSAPRWPFDLTEFPTDSASVLLEPRGAIWTTINRLVPGTSYYLGAWWFWDDSGQGPANLTFEVDTRDPAALYLTDGRFRVEANWHTSTAAAAAAAAVPLTDDTGYFWFFDRANVEVVVKVLDACAFNGRFWVFSSGLTNVGVDIVVTDLATGAIFRVSNPLGSDFVPRFATDAFTCP